MTKPMLASPADLKNLTFPLLGSAKLDGIRCIIHQGRALSRTLKPIPNQHIREELGHTKFNGLDGELIVGKPTAPDTYRVTNSGVMGQEGIPDWTYWVFDMHDRDAGYYATYDYLKVAMNGAHPRIQLLMQTFIANHDELLAFEEGALEAGFEGVILRRPQSPYKWGRATSREQYLLKLKRVETSECIITGIEPLYHNENEAETNELGRTKRSTMAEGLVAMETMGALKVRDIVTGVEFHLGTGFTAAERDYFWKWVNGPTFDKNRIVTYNHFPIGVKLLPRHPSYKGFRDKLDM